MSWTPEDGLVEEPLLIPEHDYGICVLDDEMAAYHRAPGGEWQLVEDGPLRDAILAVMPGGMQPGPGRHVLERGALDNFERVHSGP